MRKIFILFAFFLAITSNTHLLAQQNGDESNINPYSENSDRKKDDKKDDKKVDTDTIKFKIETWHLINDFQHTEFFPIDTFLDNTHVFNPADKETTGSINLHNLGTPYKNLWYFADTKYYDFVYDQNFYSFLLTPENITNYRSNKPFTVINYATSLKKVGEQTLNILHTQNVNKRLNLGILYNLISAKGQLLNEKTRNPSYGAFLSYNGRHYTLYTNVTVNKIKIQYNGGVPDDTTKYSETTPVQLEGVASNYTNQNYFFTHKWALGKEVKYQVNDSVEDYYVIPKVSISHTFLYQRKSRTFKVDELTNFFPERFNHDTTTYDSLSYNNLSNTVALLFNENPDTKFNFRLKTYITQEYIKSNMFSDSAKLIEQQMNNTYIGATLYNFRTSKWAWYANARYCIISPRKQNDFEGKALLSRTIFFKNDSVNISLSGTLRQLKPSYNYSAYRGNNTQWNIPSMNQISEQIFSGSLSIPAFRLEAGAYMSRSQYNIFIDEDKKPYQDSVPINLLSIYVKKDFYFWKFRWLNHFIWQENDQNDNLHLPKIIWSSTFRYDETLFKVLDIQVGVQSIYTSEYMASAFDPASGFYYRQNTKKTGNYFILDAFLDMKVRKVQIFLKYTNLLRIKNDNMYFPVSNYPLNAPTFYYGVNWRFHN